MAEDVTGYKSPTETQLQAIQVIELKLKELRTLSYYYCRSDVLKPFIEVKIVELSALIKESIKG